MRGIGAGSDHRAAMLSGVQYLGIRVIAGALGFAAYILFSRWVTPAEFGRYSIILAGASGLAALCHAWIGIAIARELPARSKDQDVFVSSAMAVFLAASLLSAGVSFSTVLWFGWPFERAVYLLILANLAGWFEVSCYLANTRLQVGAYGMKSLLRFGGILGFGSLFIQLTPSAEALLLAHGLGLTLAALHTVRADLTGIAIRKLDRATFHRLLGYGGPIALVMAMGWVVELSDRVLIAWLLDDAATGRYALAYEFAKQPVWLVMSGAVLAILPRAATAFEAEGERRARSVLASGLSILLVVGLPLVLMAAIKADDIARLFLGAAYREAAVAIMPVVAVATGLHAVRGYYFDISLHLLRRTPAMLGMWSLMAVTNVLLNLVLIPTYGVVGAAYATLAAHAVSLAFFLCMPSAWRLLGASLHDVARIVGAAAVFALCVGLWPSDLGHVAFFASAVVSGAAYLLVLLALDGLSLRSMLLAAARSRGSVGN